MQIGELSRASGVSVRMLRYYEAQGLLSPGRSAAGYRIYSRNALETVRRITTLNRAGLPLDRIRGLLECPFPDAAGAELCETMKEQIRQQLSVLDDRMAELEQSRRLLAAYLGSGPAVETTPDAAA
ncbi:MerR family transcriptional regulator [Acidimangrovimonas pyrenivorans]|uniref:MerR family transcriptional regulator n=1 Tax=Acidimangrovimonas pyrenivorans TaxID=2030798 RepID=A0ABV7ACD2_9RHOB